MLFYPCSFRLWFRPDKYLSDLDFITNTLSLAQNEDPYVQAPKVVEGELYATTFSEDGLYYRCKVLQCMEDEKVRFFDKLSMYLGMC